MFMRTVAISLLAVGALADECTQDMANIWLNNEAFSIEIKNCAVDSMGDANEVSACLMAAHSELSSGCAACFGQTVACGRDNCMQACIGDSFAAECIQCTETEGCNAQLAACTGFEGPPVPGTSTTTSGVSTISTVSIITVGILALVVL